jgi:tetratricopeptide (TPR) repeat protein
MHSTGSPELIIQIRHLCAEGYALYDSGAFKDALRLFYQAWLLLPKPQTDYEAAGWVLTAIGDTYFRMNQYEQGREALESALYCPETDQSSFVHLRLGQCHWELLHDELARHSLLRAYDMGQTEIFAAEDPKYYLAIADYLNRQSVSPED